MRRMSAAPGGKSSSGAPWALRPLAPREAADACQGRSVLSGAWSLRSWALVDQHDDPQLFDFHRPLSMK